MTESVPLNEDKFSLDVGQRPTEELALGSAGLNEVTKAIARLTPDRKQVVEEVFFKGKKIREVATEVGISESGVRNRLRVALKNLRTKLKNHKEDLVED